MDKRKFIITTNILLLIIVFSITWYYFSSLYVLGHSYFWAYFSNFNFSNFQIPNARVPALVIDKFLSDYFPKMFDVTAQMFKTNFLCIIIQLTYFLGMIFLFSKSFFLFRETKRFKDILTRKEDILLFTLVFSILVLPFYNGPHPLSYPQYTTFFIGARESAVFFEFQGGYIVWFPFIYYLLEAIFIDKEQKKYNNIIPCIFAFFAGFWAEIINMPICSMLFFIGIYISIFYREKLKNKNMWLLIIWFIIGLLFYYVGTGKFGINKIGTIGNYNIIEQLKTNLYLFNSFKVEFIEALLVKQKYYLILAFILDFFVIACKSKHEIKTRIHFVSICALIILSQYVLLFSTFLICNYREGITFYIARHDIRQMTAHLIMFVILLKMGYLYTLANNKIRNIFLVMCLILTGFSFYKLEKTYTYHINENIEMQNLLNNIEKKYVIFSMFNESLYLSNELKKSYRYKEGEILSGALNVPDNYTICIRTNNQAYMSYFDNNFKTNMKALVWLNEKDANEKYNERIRILESLYRMKYGENFDITKLSQKKLEKLMFKNEDIENLEKEATKNPLIYKIIMKINLENSNLDKAEEINKMLFDNGYENDIDVLYNYLIYEKKKNNKVNVIKTLYKLCEIDTFNILLRNTLLNELYEQKNYIQALSLCEEMLKIDENIKDNINLNKAIIYKNLKEKENSKNYIELINNEKLLNFYNNYNINSFEEFYNNEIEYDIQGEILEF